MKQLKKHDGAPAMIGRINGVAALLKKEIPTLFTMCYS